MLLQACLGLEIDAPHRTIRVHQPTLPDSIHHLQINHLPINHKEVSIHFERQASQTVVWLTPEDDHAVTLQVNYR